jgi:uroporphyrinogen III methyltransferase/synthase
LWLKKLRAFYMPKPKVKITLVTRASALALQQSQEIISLLPPSVVPVIKPIVSWGDKHKHHSLMNNSVADIFTRELDQALLRGQGDLAVHSAKDLPYPLAEGLEVIALLPAAEQTDCLASRGGLKLKQLPRGAKVGTSSPLRQEQMNRLRPDLKAVDIRGTIEERLAKINSGEVDAVIVATCALKRLRREAAISEILPIKTHALQGHLAVVARDDREDLKALFAAYDLRRKFGTVVLAGFGPGDPELLTQKAARHLAQADLIVYDDLLPASALEQYSGEKIYVGKRRGQQAYSQQAIQELLHVRAKGGQKVVRLKGGDPFVFGRGGEELDFLKERLICVEVVPGISSALGAAAYTEIPLTQRGVASSVAFCTGHAPGKIAVPQTDTLVYYMAADHLPAVARALLAAGRDPLTPVACVLRATWPDQQVHFTTLKKLQKKSAKLVSPLLIIVGQVAARGRKRNWFAKQKKILFTGLHPEHFRHLGTLVPHPLMEVKALREYRRADEQIKQVARFHWLVFTSQHAVKYFFTRLRELRLDSRALQGVRLASVGSQTTRALGEQGLVPDLQATEETAQGLVAAFASYSIRGWRVLLPQSNLASRTLVQGLNALGHRVTTLVVYHTAARPKQDSVDWRGIQEVFFTSPSGVRNFKHQFGKIPAKVQAMAIGPVTGKALRHAKI